MANEKTFFQYEDVAVTNSRFMVGSHTFAMNNITSVKASKLNPSRVGPLFVISIGVLILVYGSGSLTAGLAIAASGVVWWFIQKPMYHVMLRTAGGEASALSSRQRDYIEKVIQALNDAIVARG